MEKVKCEVVGTLNGGGVRKDARTIKKSVWR